MLALTVLMGIDIENSVCFFINLTRKLIAIVYDFCIMDIARYDQILLRQLFNEYEN